MPKSPLRRPRLSLQRRVDALVAHSLSRLASRHANPFDQAFGRYLAALSGGGEAGRDKARAGLGRALSAHLTELGMANWRVGYIHGPRERLHVDDKLLRINALYNTRSGEIWIGEGTVVGHNCMFLTGRHVFEGGRLKLPRSEQVPESGYDIRVGRGCWIASGAIVLGGVTIEDHAVVAAGAVVTKNVRTGTIVGGVPATEIGRVA